MQRLDDLLLGFSPHLEDEKRIKIELLFQEVIDGSDMLAGVRPIGAGTICFQIRSFPGKERYAAIGKRLIKKLYL
jgi:hypothetical protein